MITYMKLIAWLSEKKYEIIFLVYVAHKIENAKNMIILLSKNMEKFANTNDKMIIFRYIHC